MKRFVSGPWIIGVTVFLSILLVGSVRAPEGFAGISIGWAGLTLATALVVALVSRHSREDSMGEVIATVEAEPRRHAR